MKNAALKEKLIGTEIFVDVILLYFSALDRKFLSAVTKFHRAVTPNQTNTISRLRVKQITVIQRHTQMHFNFLCVSIRSRKRANKQGGSAHGLM